MSQELERLHLINQDKDKKYDEVSRNRSSMENQFKYVESDRNRLNDEFRKVSSENNGLKLQINRIENEMQELVRERSDIGLMDQRLREAGAEIERLNRLIQGQSSELNELREQNRQLQYQISNVSILERENQELRRNAGDTDKFKRTITEYENKLALISAEIERLKEVTKKEKDQNAGLRDENERLKREITSIETNIRNSYETKIQQIRTEHETHITNIINRGNPEADQKINSLVQELDRLNTLLARMQQENNELKVKLRDIEILHDRQEREAIEIINQQNAKIRSLEYTNSELQRELFDLKERLNRAGQSEQEIITIRRDYERLVADYQNQDALVRQLQNILLCLALRSTHPEFPIPEIT